MKNKSEKANCLTSCGASLLNKLPALSRKNRKRDADKRRRKSGKREILSQLKEL